MIDLNEVRVSEPVPQYLNHEPVEDEIRGSEETRPISKEPARSPADPATADSRDSQLSALKRKCLNLAKERALALAISGESLIPGVTDQLLTLLKDRVIAEEAGEHEIRVMSRDGRSVTEAVKEWLASPEFRHFRPAGNRGGVLRKSETTLNEGSPGFTPEPPQARSLNDLVIERWKNRTRTRGKEGLWPRIP